MGSYQAFCETPPGGYEESAMFAVLSSRSVLEVEFHRIRVLNTRPSVTIKPALHRGTSSTGFIVQCCQQVALISYSHC